ncbi:MAG: serine hydrolase [Acetobacteraceae bacterium]|nr:serine hydrolase [Acetobacteraceae bacterium]
MPPISPNLADASPTFEAPGPAAPFVYDIRPSAMRQRVVNYAAKRLVDMAFVTGLPPQQALQHFRRKPVDAPGTLSETADIPAHAAEVEAAWTSSAIRAEFDAADRRVTVKWQGDGFTVTGSAFARPSYGGILLGPHATARFDPAPLDRPAARHAPWPLGNDFAVAAPVLGREADAFFASSPGLYGVLVATPERVLFERYSAHGGPDRPTPSWSMTKAITATLIGRVLQMGWLRSVHDPAPAPLWTDHRDARRLITLDHLLRMRSGLGYPTFDGERSGLGFENSFVYHDAEDAFETAQRAIVITTPGSTYRYINSGLNVLGAIIRDQIERRGLPYHRTVYSLLADPIGMTTYQHSADIAGNLIASGSGFAVLRDYARLGLLYIQDGVWAGERLLPPGWVEYALTPSHTGTPYAACFRSNADGTFPSLPRNTAWAAGASEQRVIILREQHLVIAVANETDHPIDLPALDRFAASAVALAERPALRSVGD